MARALALLGMILVHFHLVVASGTETPHWLAAVIESLQGRAAATFVILAGVGASLGSRRARLGDDPVERRRARITLARRGLFLLVAGVAFLPVWPADILHSYGVWLAAGSLLMFVSTAVLLGVSLIAAAVGVAFLAQGTYFDHWNLGDLSYRGLWTPAGFTRNLFLDGWNPFFPWFGLYVYGMALGRMDLHDAGPRRKVLLRALALAAAMGAISVLAPSPLLDSAGALALLATTATPPTPGFLLFAGAAATVTILVCVEVGLARPSWIRPLAWTGQLALTLYIGHVIVGLGTLESMGRLEGQSLPYAVNAALMFFASAVVFSVVWRRFFRRGPLEAVMRFAAR